MLVGDLLAMGFSKYPRLEEWNSLGGKTHAIRFSDFFGTDQFCCLNLERYDRILAG